jgi:RNase H-like domain found in reverse transcriptase/Reverse transcriptase (RNA-dependent DNA polymerase)
MMIDSGAEVNTLCEDDWSKVRLAARGSDALRNLKWGDGRRTLTAYASAAPLEVLATFEASIIPARGKPPISAKFHVIAGANKSLLGRSTAVALGVLRMGLSVNECELKPQEAEGQKTFPKVPGVAIHFEVDKNVPPTQNAYYNVPAAFRQRARARLEDMEAQDIIEEVPQPPRWISGMSLVPKGKFDFRLVVNMRGPNRAILRAYHPLPTIDDIRYKLTGAKVFSKLDIKSAFYHLELDEASRELTTFQTERGMRRFKRLMFGVNCAPEIFQRTMEKILAGIEGLVIFIDDILIYGETLGILRDRTKKVLTVLKDNNLLVNDEKSEYEKESLTFLGHQLSAEGFAIDEAKTRDVESFKRPENTTDLRSFLGLVTYLSEYIPKFADLTAPLWDVVKGPTFRWTTEAQSAFERCKKEISSCTTRLGFFDETWNTILYADASPSALGAVLVQEKEGERPRIICFVSKALTSTEQNYPQIQREALAIVWAVERLYYYLLGRRFTIRTDACGLAFIFNREKETSKRSLNRAEAWALRLSTYDYKIEWIKGEANIADPSSRLATNQTQFTPKIRTPVEICDISTTAQRVGTLTVPDLVEATEKDEELMTLKKALELDVWPENVASYKTMKDELRFKEGLVFRMGSASYQRH